jgi:opacity protein-like surface antigen
VAYGKAPWFLGVVTMLLATAALAAAPDQPWYLTLYLQEGFPKQTNTNKQIQQINQTFGVRFKDWSDVHNLSLGAQLFKRVSPRWKLGLQVDYSAGSIDGTATIPTEAGPARLAFEQRYDLYADLYVVAHFLPCPSCTRVVPFVYGGGGIGYEKDKTTLTLANEFLNEDLRVDNDGWFPTFSLGAGIDVPLSRRDTWYLELGGAYAWARLKHNVPAKGTLAPAPQVLADTDSSGPNYWVGIGLRF